MVSRRLDIHVEPQIFYRASRSIIFWKVLRISRREMVISPWVLRNSRRIYVFFDRSYVISGRAYVFLTGIPVSENDSGTFSPLMGPRYINAVSANIYSDNKLFTVWSGPAA